MDKTILEAAIVAVEAQLAVMRAELAKV